MLYIFFIPQLFIYYTYYIIIGVIHIQPFSLFASEISKQILLYISYERLRVKIIFDIINIQIHNIYIIFLLDRGGLYKSSYFIQINHKKKDLI